MDRIKKLFESPLEAAVAVSGIGLVAFYLLYARRHILAEPSQKTIPNESSLDLSLKQLIQPRRPNIYKIVFTESLNTKSQFKGILLTRLKQFLLSLNLHVLVNCSPLKLFNASTEIFVSTLSQDDADDEKEFMSYFENALKCQLLIERTVIDIEKIKNKDQPVFLLCDTNSLDLKAHSDPELWGKFLAQSQISESELTNDYNIVFHVPNSEYMASPKMGAKRNQVNKQKDMSDDQKIKLAWRNFEKYYEIQQQPDMDMQQNVESSLKKMILMMKQFLPQGTEYKPTKTKPEHSND